MDIFREYYDFCETKLPDFLRQLPLSEKRKLAVYGMGEHTEHLLLGYQKKIGPINVELIFIDSKRATCPSGYFGCDIYNVHDIGELELDGIILSSYIYEEEMYQTIQKLYGNRFPIYRFYSSSDRKYFLPSGAHIQKVKEIDEDDAYYMNMLAQAPMREDYDFDVLLRLEKFLSEIIEKE